MLFAMALILLAACGGSSPIVQDLGVDQNRESSSSSGSSAPLRQDSQGLDIGRDTTWQEVFDTLPASDQACIREELGEQSFGSVMARPLLEYLDSDIADMEAGLGVFKCIPDIFVTALAPVLGANPEEMSQDERSCLRDWIRNIDSATLAAAEDDDTAAIEIGFGIMACVPEFLVASVAQDAGVELGALSDEEKSCLQDWARGIDPDALAAEGDDAAAIGVGFGIFACVPELFAASFGEEEGLEPFEVYGDAANNGVNAFENAMPAIVGEAVGGGIENVDDVDYFVFRAEAGVAYLIDVAPETMSDPTLELFDSNLVSLDYSDDYDGLAPRIQWIAPRSDSHYVAVGGYDEGTYTLTIALASARNEGDDHADWSGNATVVAVDALIPGAIEDNSDVDFFEFRAEAGVAYQIDVAPETMSDPTLELFDSNLVSLDYSDDYDGLAPRIQWIAPSSGTYFVAIEGFDLGSYTLTIATRT